MRTITNLLIAAAALAAPISAQATVTPSLGGGTTDFLALTSAGLGGGAIATLTGGSVYSASLPTAAKPAGSIFGGTFLAAGIAAGATSTLTFTSPVTYLSFLWGSPDTYNALTVTSTNGVQTFSATGLGFSVTNGDAAFSQYVQFAALPGSAIQSVTFSNSPNSNAFEVANFSIGSVIPEPETWGLMILGMSAVAFVRRRRTNMLSRGQIKAMRAR